jgi:superkiller protein 3
VNIDEVIQSAREKHLAGNIEQAEHLYRKILASQPDNVVTAYELGNILFNRGYLDEAGAYYEKALKTDPGFAAAYHKLGEIHQDKIQFDKAIVCL